MSALKNASSQWQALFEAQAAAERDGALNGRCECKRALVKATWSGEFCPACMRADFDAYGNDS